MRTAVLDFTRKKERILARRAARARRSKWLGRVLFFLTTFGLLVAAQMNPVFVSDIFAYVTREGHKGWPMIRHPSQVQVLALPADVIPFRPATQQPGYAQARADVQTTENNMRLKLEKMASDK